MRFETERIILRPWEETDTDSLYEYAKDERIGPVTGWLPHTSVENSREIIKTILSVPENYAVCLQADNRAVGCIGLTRGAAKQAIFPCRRMKVNSVSESAYLFGDAD